MIVFQARANPSSNACTASNRPPRSLRPEPLSCDNLAVWRHRCDIALSKYTLAALLIAGSITALALTARQASQGPAVPGVVGTHTENGLAGFAKILCSGVFVSGRAPEDVAQGSAYFFMPPPSRTR